MHTKKGQLGQVLPNFWDPKKEIPRGPTRLTPRRMQSPRGALLKRLTNMHKQKGPSGQVLPKFLGPQEGEPKGAKKSDTKENAEPKGAPTQKSISNAHEERPIGASAARFQGPQEGEPKGAVTPDTKKLEDPEGASRKETITMVEEGASQMGEARGDVAAGEGALGSAEQSATYPRQTHTCGQGQHAYGKVNVANTKAKG